MKKIAVRVPQWLGDAVVSTVFLTHLKAKAPGSEIHVLVPHRLASLFVAHPAVTSVVPLGAAGENIFQMARQLRTQKFDEVYILPRSLRTALESWLARIPRRIGFSGDFRSPFLSHVFSYDEKLIYPRRYLKLINEETTPLENLHPYFPKVELSEEEASKIMGVPLKDLGRPFLGIAPASVAKARTWFPERFTEVAQKFLKEKGGTIFLFGSSKESEVAAAVVSQVKQAVVDLTGKLDFPQLGWFLSNMSAFLGNDSGLMHVASAFDVPSIILFGPSDPTWALPQTGRFQSLQHKEIFCVPCLRNDCVRLGNDYKACMKAIEPEAVYSALAGVLK